MLQNDPNKQRRLLVRRIGPNPPAHQLQSRAAPSLKAAKPGHDIPAAAPQTTPSKASTQHASPHLPLPTSRVLQARAKLPSLLQSGSVAETPHQPEHTRPVARHPLSQNVSYRSPAPSDA